MASGWGRALKISGSIRGRLEGAFPGSGNHRWCQHVPLHIVVYTTVVERMPRWRWSLDLHSLETHSSRC